MRFSKEQIELARSFKAQGLPWEPSVGNYIYDETGFLGAASRMQNGVHFLLDYDFVMRQTGGVSRLKELMVWLPDWQDAREILQSLGVNSANIERQLIRSRAFSSKSELTELYGLILTALRQRRWDKAPA